MSDQLPGGYAGRILRIDLTSERIWTESMAPEDYRHYLGAVGVGTKILWEEVPPEVTWDHPENRIVLASGPLAGTPVWGTGSLTVVTRGAMTNGATVTNAQGFFGANLKYSGYDAIVLQGQANRWVYVYINDDLVELRDASHLLGQDTWDMQDTLQAEHGRSGHQLSVYGIGPAGEKVVRWAIIEGDYGHVASKNGTGAVLGKKKVKCVAIARGTRGVRVHDPAGLFQAADMISHELKTDSMSANLYRFGTLGGVYGGSFTGTLPTKNYTTNIFPEPERLEEWQPTNLRAQFAHRGHQCNGCGMQHCHMNVIPSGEHKGTLIDESEYEGLSGCGAQIGCVDPVDVQWLNTQVDKAGVDVNEFGWVIGWVMECFEKGYLTKEQLGGLEPKWGDAEAANTLLQMITNREGFGDILAEGVKIAAHHVGGPALDCAVFTHKGVSPRGHDHRSRWAEMLEGAVQSAGTIETGPTGKTGGARAARQPQRLRPQGGRLHDRGNAGEEALRGLPGHLHVHHSHFPQLRMPRLERGNRLGLHQGRGDGLWQAVLSPDAPVQPAERRGDGPGEAVGAVLVDPGRRSRRGTERQGELGYPGGHLLRHRRMGPGDGKPPSGDPPQV